MTTPPGGTYRYTHPETNFEITAPTYGDMLAKTRSYFVGNNFPITMNWEAEVQDRMCQLLVQAGKGDWCGEGIRGLGDIVYMIANPIAFAADALLGTNIQGCRGCGQRQDSLNQAVPIQ